LGLDVKDRLIGVANVSNWVGGRMPTRSSMVRSIDTVE
jgi:hypothetical protein